MAAGRDCGVLCLRRGAVAGCCDGGGQDVAAGRCGGHAGGLGMTTTEAGASAAGVGYVGTMLHVHLYGSRMSPRGG